MSAIGQYSGMGLALAGQLYIGITAVAMGSVAEAPAVEASPATLGLLLALILCCSNSRSSSVDLLSLPLSFSSASPQLLLRLPLASESCGMHTLASRVPSTGKCSWDSTDFTFLMDSSFSINSANTFSFDSRSRLLLNVE